MTVCAIILDYFGAQKTDQCLASLTHQGINTIYVVDNSGSGDASNQLGTAIGRVRAHGPDYAVEILSPGENLGFAKGVNFAISHDRRSESPHDYYLLLNNDALAGRDLVRGLLAALQQSPRASIAAPRIISSDPGREYGVWYHRYLGLLLSRPTALSFHYLTGCCLLVSKDVVRNNGLFDEAFFMYGEDAELGWRLTREGRRPICATNVFVRHELGPSVDRTKLFYEYHMVRGHLLLSLKTSMHPVEIPFLLLTKSLALACRAIIRSLRHHTLTPLASLLLALLPVDMTRLHPNP